MAAVDRTAVIEGSSEARVRPIRGNLPLSMRIPKLLKVVAVEDGQADRSAAEDKDAGAAGAGVRDELASGDGHDRPPVRRRQ